MYDCTQFWSHATCHTPLRGSWAWAFAWECLHAATLFFLSLHTFGVTSCVVKVNWLPRVILILSFSHWLLHQGGNFYFCKWKCWTSFTSTRDICYIAFILFKRDSGNSPEEKAFVLYLDSRLPWIATDITPATSRMLCSWVGYMALWYPRRRGHGQWGLNWRIVLIHLHEDCNWCRGTTVPNKVVRMA